MADAPPKRLGRPRLSPDDISVDVHFRLQAKAYDLMLKHAAAARLSHTDWLRQVIAGKLKRP